MLAGARAGRLEDKYDHKLYSIVNVQILARKGTHTLSETPEEISARVLLKNLTENSRESKKSYEFGRDHSRITRKTRCRHFPGRTFEGGWCYRNRSE